MLARAVFAFGGAWWRPDPLDTICDDRPKDTQGRSPRVAGTKKENPRAGKKRREGRTNEPFRSRHSSLAAAKPAMP
ncbi:MAG TPA: hypothetical protein VJ740_17660, partial [Hyphomicrobiaceae bacterium]|nr:hypothetical protein [Hyphomicrobiaceae bacterium]